MRMVIPLTIVVTLTAIYALFVRTREYGLTVERFWGFIVASTALIYAAGYSVAAVRKGAWFGGIARVNVVVAIALICALCLSLTPLLSPYRLTAGSQYALVLAGRYKPSSKPYQHDTPFHYLRFNSGAYGRRRLEELAHLQNHSDAEHIRGLASAALRLTSPWESAPAVTASAAFAKMVIYPSGRTLDADLSRRLLADLDDPKQRYLLMLASDRPLAGLFVDLSVDRSGSEEFVLLSGGSGVVYQRSAAGWREAGRAYETGSDASQQNIPSELARGNVSTKDPAWRELWIGNHRIRVQ